MATESAMRLVGSGGARKWSSSETMAFSSSSSNVAANELGLLLREHKFHGNRRDAVPNRSGSAPPNMEGSFAAIVGLIRQQTSSMEGSLASLNSAIENCETEEQLRSDPAYLAYYSANVNVNPRLPPPLISRGNKRLAYHIGSSGDSQRLSSLDDSSNGSLFLSKSAPSTHKEKPPDERLPRQVSGEWAEQGTGFLSEKLTKSLTGLHKSLVDLIQEDFPRTPSPVYNQHHSSSQAEEEEVGHSDALGNLLLDSSTSPSKLQELNIATIGIHASTSTPGIHGIGSILNSDSSPEARVPSSSSPTLDGNLCPSIQGESNSGDVHLDNDIDNVESEIKAFSISKLSNVGSHIIQQEWQHPQPSNLPGNQSHQQRSATSHFQGTYHQMITQGMHQLYNGNSKSSTVDVLQPAFQTSGETPPLYASAAAYMTSANPFYPNLQPSSAFAPQYSIGGFALNPTLLPSFVAGYPPPGSIPMAFENSVGSSFTPRPAAMSSGGSFVPGVDLQHLYRFYGQLGLPMQPSFTDPLYTHYFQHPPPEDPYRALGQYDPLAMRGDVMGSQDTFDSKKCPPLASYTVDQKSHHSSGGALSIPSLRKVGVAGPDSYGSPSSMGLLMQYPTSPLASLVLPGSPISGTSHPDRKSENIRFPLSPYRNLGAYSGWRGQRGAEKIDDSKPFSFLEELKSGRAHRFELSDIAGRIVEFSSDQHGSRFIQQKLENCSAKEKASVFVEVLPHAQTLMIDVFGNYIIQKFFEHGSSEQRKELANQLSGRVLALSLQMYGCRVIQKALEVIELGQKTKLVLELDGHVMQCVRHQNGNHVIQKCIECVPTEKIGFIISVFQGQVATLSTHPYGCRVIQRVLEHCTDEHQTQWMVDEILQSACSLAQDQYGNYLTQHVLEKGKPHERSQIISKLAGQVVQMSQHKFASNVIEKCLELGGSAEREFLIEEIVGQTEGNDSLLVMMKDQFANYVVQKILETCTDKQREVLLGRIRIHLQALKKYTFGKHIVARVEQLSGEETCASES